MTVFSYGNNQNDPLFRQASQVFRIAAHPLCPHANCTVAGSTETRLSVLNQISKNVAQYISASNISVVMVKNAKPGFC